MFGQLLIKECKQTFKSLIYWLIVLVLLFDFATQLGGDTEIRKEPQKGESGYGYRSSDDPTLIMKATLGSLVEQFAYDRFVTYPIGFYKHVTLNGKEEKQIEEILQKTTGLSGRAEAEQAVSDWYEAQNTAPGPDGAIMPAKSMEIAPAPDMTYDRFSTYMDEVDSILGGGSSYAKDAREHSASVPMTYEEAMEEYRELTEQDRLTGGYARLFSDYMGIFLGVLPVFLAVTRALRDKRAGMQDLIYTRKGSSFAIIASRYTAMLVMLVLPLLALSLLPLSDCLRYASSAGISADPFAYVKYIFGWLLPTIMTAAAVGMFLTELTDTALAILIQGAWWFVSVFTGALHGGAYGWNLIPRHNTVMNWSGYHDHFSQLAANRILYVFLSVILVVLTVLIYQQKRKGRYRLSWNLSGRLKK